MEIIKQFLQKLHLIANLYNKIATLGTDKVADVDRQSVVIVNSLAFITGSMVLSIGLFFYGLIHSKMLLYGILFESSAFYSLLYLNSIGKHKAAKFGLIAVHSFSAVYFGALLGMVLCVELIAAFLIAFLLGGACLIFPGKKERAICMGIVAFLMVIIEANNYYQVIRPLELSHVNFYYFRWFSVGGMLVLLSVGIWLMVRSNMLLIQEMKNADVARRNFLSSTSHDLRTPMDAIYTAAQALKLHLKDSHRSLDLNAIESALKTILPASIYSKGIINDILDLSKIEAGIPAEIKKESFHTISWVHNFMEILAPLATQKGIKLTLRVDRIGIPAFIHTDRLKLTKLVVNLVINAIKYAPQDTEVVISLEYINPILAISVHNQGMIPLELQPRLFDAYVRGENLDQTGNGLGLHIVDSLIKRLDGNISFISRADVGTEFIVQFQGIASEGAGLRPSDQIMEERDRSFIGKKILVIDDSETTLIALKALYKDSNLLYNAEDGLSGLQEAKLIRPDIIFLDSNMPKMSGLQTLQHIREDDNLRSVPVVLVSADAYKETNQLYMTAGASDFLSKPLDFSDIKSVMCRLL